MVSRTDDVLVVGAGVVGLTCAVRLQEAGARVKILAAEEPSQTVSRIAAAVWYPVSIPGDPRALRWAQRTYDELAAQAERGVPGVVMLPTRNLLREPATEPPWWGPAVRDLRAAPLSEVPSPYAGEWRFTCPAAEMGPYLDWLLERFLSAGGALSLRRISALTEVGDMAPVVINATGLAAGALVGDAAVHPVRGHILVVKNPGLTVSVRDEDGPEGATYVHPRRHDVVLGGTFEVGATSLTPDPETRQAILERCAALVPEIAGAEVLSEHVGLRPGRHGGARLEEDPQRLPGGARLIHCYGHAGAGPTLSWGCAEDVVGLVSAPMRGPWETRDVGRAPG